MADCHGTALVWLLLVKSVRCLVAGANEPFMKTKPPSLESRIGLIFILDENGSKVSRANPISEQGSPRLASVVFTASRNRAEPSRGCLTL